jgi:hypothetical protein
MEMPKPTDAHKKLERLAGRWKGEEKIHPSPWEPKGGMAIARINNRTALDGFSVIQDYEQERNGAVNFRGHGVFTYDPTQQCYIMHWWDTMGMPMSEYKGNFEGNVLTLSSKNPQGLSRAVFDLHKEGKYTFKMEGSQDGKLWHTFMEGNYNRE